MADISQMRARLLEYGELTFDELIQFIRGEPVHTGSFTLRWTPRHLNGLDISLDEMSSSKSSLIRRLYEHAESENFYLPVRNGAEVCTPETTCEAPQGTPEAELPVTLQPDSSSPDLEEGQS